MSEWPPFPPPHPPQPPASTPQLPTPPTYGYPTVPAPPPPPTVGGVPPVPPPAVASPYGFAPYGPPSATAHLPRAGFGARFAAYLVDLIVITLLMVAAMVPLFAIGIATFQSEPGVCTDSVTGERYACELPTAGTVVSWLLFSLVFMVISVGVVYLIKARPLSRTGQTIGKRALNIRVVREDSGQLLTGGQAVGREAFAYFISAQIFYLGYLWMLWDDKKQTWQDKVVSSIVVRTR